MVLLSSSVLKRLCLCIFCNFHLHWRFRYIESWPTIDRGLDRWKGTIRLMFGRQQLFFLYLKVVTHFPPSSRLRLVCRRGRDMPWDDDDGIVSSQSPAPYNISAAAETRKYSVAFLNIFLKFFLHRDEICTHLPHCRHRHRNRYEWFGDCVRRSDRLRPTNMQIHIKKTQPPPPHGRRAN